MREHIGERERYRCLTWRSEIGLSLVIVAVSTPISEFFSTVIPTSNFVFNFFNALLWKQILDYHSDFRYYSNHFQRQACESRRSAGAWYILYISVFCDDERTGIHQAFSRRRTVVFRGMYDYCCD